MYLTCHRQVVDNSSAFRMTEGVPLVIPEINADAVKAAGITAGKGGIIANPNCSTIIMLMAVAPLHRAAGVKRVVVRCLNAHKACQTASCTSQSPQKPLAQAQDQLPLVRSAAEASKRMFWCVRNHLPDGLVWTPGEHVPGSQRRGAGGDGRARTADAGSAGRRGGHHQHLSFPGAARL